MQTHANTRSVNLTSSSPVPTPYTIYCPAVDTGLRSSRLVSSVTTQTTAPEDCNVYDPAINEFGISLIPRELYVISQRKQPPISHTHTHTHTHTHAEINQPAGGK